MHEVTTVHDLTSEPSDAETFMCPRHLAWFQQQLVAWRDEILRNADGTRGRLEAADLRAADIADRACDEADWTRDLRAVDRQRKVLAKIHQALIRIRDGEYGYCEITGEPIALARLIARPVASMTIEAQTMHERRERMSSAA